MLIWAMFDCRYKLDQVVASWYKLEGAKERKEVLNHNLVNWIGTSSKLDSKAETPDFKNSRIQSTG